VVAKLLHYIELEITSLDSSSWMKKSN